MRSLCSTLLFERAALSSPQSVAAAKRSLFINSGAYLQFSTHDKGDGLLFGARFHSKWGENDDDERRIHQLDWGNVNIAGKGARALPVADAAATAHDRAGYRGRSKWLVEGEPKERARERELRARRICGALTARVMLST